MKVTIQSVADRASVSVGTVSRVLNNDPSVSADLSQRVRQSVAELGYKPLRKRRSALAGEEMEGKTIGLLTLGMDRSLAQLPVVTAAVDGIREEMSASGAGLQIFDLPDPTLRPDWLRRGGVDGWLIKGAMQGDLLEAIHPQLKTQLEHQPCIWFHGRPSGAPGFGVGVNDWEAGALAANHLFGMGHRDVAFLSPKRDHALLKRRQHGFASRCEELGMNCEVVSQNSQTWNFPLERPRSLAAVETLLERLLGGKARPSVIFVPADSIAVLLYRALAERSIAIPEEISVMSVNHEMGLTAGLFPSLTTIDIRSHEVGREAVRMLRRRFEKGQEESGQDVQLDPVLVEGESVRPA